MLSSGNNLCITSFLGITSRFSYTSALCFGTTNIILCLYFAICSISLQVVFGPNPVRVMCPNGHEVTTNITYKCGGFACLVSCLLCWLNPHIIGPFCALIPLCVKDLKDVEHTCPVDAKVLGVFKRSSF